MNEKETEALLKGAGCCLGVASAISLVVGRIFIHGFVLCVLWLWFIAPIFNLPTLSILQAAGINLVVSFLSYRSRIGKKIANEDLSKLVLENLVIMPAIVLVAAYILHLFI